MKKPLPKSLIHLARLGIILAVLIGSSCTMHPQPPAEVRSSERLSGAGELLFLQGRYEEALREFQRLYQSADLSDQQRNQALYGLACTQIVVARTDRELAEGIGNLGKWDKERGDGPFGENPRLLVQAVAQQSEVLVKKNREQQKKVSRKDRQINNQKEKIGQLNETIARLQKQLEELEMIDENFQERRKTL